MRSECAIGWSQEFGEEMHRTMRSPHALTAWINASLTAAAGFLLLLLPARWSLRGSRAATLDGIETLDDAAAACRRTGLAGQSRPVVEDPLLATN